MAAAAAWPCSRTQGADGVWLAVRTAGAAVRWGRGVGALGGAAKAESAGERRRTWPAMVLLTGKEEDGLGKR